MSSNYALDQIGQVQICTWTVLIDYLCIALWSLAPAFTNCMASNMPHHLWWWSTPSKSAIWPGFVSVYGLLTCIERWWPPLPMAIYIAITWCNAFSCHFHICRQARHLHMCRPSRPYMFAGDPMHRFIWHSTAPKKRIAIMCAAIDQHVLNPFRTCGGNIYTVILGYTWGVCIGFSVDPPPKT